jgi:hypothetical protein
MNERGREAPYLRSPIVAEKIKYASKLIVMTVLKFEKFGPLVFSAYKRHLAE